MTIPRDKIYHAIAGAMIGSGVFYATRSVACGIGAAAVAGIAKEIWDSFGHRDADALDALATVLGGVSACGLLKLFCR